MPQAVTVIGATGLVGQHLLRRLVRRDDVAVVHVYARSARPPSLPASVKWHAFPELDYFTDAYERPGMLDRMATVVRDGLVPGDALLSCLGTTRRVAGSASRFRFVDFALNAAFASAAAGRGYTRYGLVSSVGADASSPFLYPRVKGELETYVRGLDFAQVSLYRPGLLLGERRERRFGESLVARVTGTLGKVFPELTSASYAPIEAEAVARAMAEGVAKAATGIEVLSNSDIQRLTSYE